MAHNTFYVVLFFLAILTLNCVFTTAQTHTDRERKRERVSVFPFGPRQCDWTALFMSTIGFPLGGQTELMLQGLRVGNLRQLANQ